MMWRPQASLLSAWKVWLQVVVVAIAINACSSREGVPSRGADAVRSLVDSIAGRPVEPSRFVTATLVVASKETGPQRWAFARWDDPLGGVASAADSSGAVVVAPTGAWKQVDHGPTLRGLGGTVLARIREVSGTGESGDDYVILAAHDGTIRELWRAPATRDAFLPRIGGENQLNQFSFEAAVGQITFVKNVESLDQTGKVTKVSTETHRFCWHEMDLKFGECE